MSEIDDKIISIDEARELVSDQVLWPRVRDFLWDFAPSIHESWIDGVAQLKVDQLKVAGPRLKSFVLEKLGVEPCFHTFPKDDGSRLLLLDGATLESIAKWMGALACAEQLRRVTDGATVRSLKAALPGIYPEVFGFAAYFRGLDVWKLGSLEDMADMAARITEIGYAVLLATVKDLPEQLRHRLTLKLPRTFQQSKLPDIQTSKPQLLQLLLKLQKLRFPEAYALCC